MANDVDTSTPTAAQLAASARVGRMIGAFGVQSLPEAPTGPLVERFDSVAVAAAIEHELSAAAILGYTKITLHMDLLDAKQLAMALRKVR